MSEQESPRLFDQISKREATPRLSKVGLQTHLLDQMRHFYQRLLGFPLVNATARSVTLAIGTTQLLFEQVADDSQPYYHFAFNIPENKIEQAKSWLGDRVPILRHVQTGDEIIHFAGWQAHSLFFIAGQLDGVAPASTEAPARCNDYRCWRATRWWQPA